VSFSEALSQDDTKYVVGLSLTCKKGLTKDSTTYSQNCYRWLWYHPFSWPLVQQKMPMYTDTIYVTSITLGVRVIFVFVVVVF